MKLAIAFLIAIIAVASAFKGTGEYNLGLTYGYCNQPVFITNHVVILCFFQF